MGSRSNSAYHPTGFPEQEGTVVDIEGGPVQHIDDGKQGDESEVKHDEYGNRIEHHHVQGPAGDHETVVQSRHPDGKELKFKKAKKLRKTASKHYMKHIKEGGKFNVGYFEIKGGILFPFIPLYLCSYYFPGLVSSGYYHCDYQEECRITIRRNFGYRGSSFTRRNSIFQR